MRQARVLVICLLAVLAATFALADVPLATAGRPAASIALSRKPSGDELTAARTLQRYVERMSGARLLQRRLAYPRLVEEGGRAQVLVLGPSCPPESLAAVGIRPEDIRFNGFALVSDGRGNVVLAARDGDGIRFAAYTLLEKLGVRWLMPTEVGEVVPEAKTLSVPAMREVQNPDFPMRCVWQDWADRAKKTQDDYAIWCDRNKLGGVMYDMGHNFANVIPPATYFNDHPEYFPLINGKRSVSGDWQPCTSNPEVVRIAAETVVRFFDERPWAVCYSLSPNDGYGWCMCDECRALDPPEYRNEPNKGKARRMTLFANAVAEAVVKKHPDKYVAFYAYVGTIEPPTDIKVHPNVVIGLCHYGSVACFIHPIDAPDCEPNTNFRAIVEGWRKVTDKLAAREYFIALEAPPTDPANSVRAWTLLRDIPYYLDHGFIGLNSQTSPAWGIVSLNYYLSAKLAWDADLDPEALLADYFDKCYGPAGPKMREYLEFMRDTCLARAHKGVSVPLLTDEDIARAVRLVNEACTLAATDRQRRRVALSQDHLRYVQAARRFAAEPSEETWAAIRNVADSLENSIAIDYRLFQHLYGGPYQPDIGGPGRYQGEALNPIGLGPVPAASYEVVLPLRGANGLLLWADEGQDVWANLSCDQLGSYYDPLAYELRGPDGAMLGRGSVGIRQTRDIQCAASRAGVYNVLIGSGQNRALIKARNPYCVLRGRSLHFLGEVPRLFFFVPGGVQQFTVKVTTEAPGETGELHVYDPSGQRVLVGDTTQASVLTAEVSVPAGSSGKPWSLDVQPAASGVCDDITLELSPEVPPYLATAAERLLVPKP